MANSEFKSFTRMWLGTTFGHQSPWTPHGIVLIPIGLMLQHTHTHTHTQTHTHKYAYEICGNEQKCPFKKGTS